MLRAVSHSHHSQNGELLDFTLQFADGSATRFEALTSDFTAAISIFVQCQISARKARGAQGKIDTGGGPPSDVVVIDPKRHTERPNCFSRPMGFGRLPPPMPSTSAPLLSTQQSVLRNRISKRSHFTRPPRRTVDGEGGVSVLHQRHYPNIDAAKGDLLCLHWPEHIRSDVRHHPIAGDSKLSADNVLCLGNR